MKITPLLRDDCIRMQIRSQDKEEVIEELLTPLVRTEVLTPEQGTRALTRLVERERQSSTGIDCGVAVPHCRVGFLKHPLVNLGFSREGLDFGSFDGSLSRIFFLVIVPEKQPKLHIQVLSTIARLLAEESSREELLGCESPAQVIQTIGALEDLAGI
jgi:mannitol/fructose-specific phosphotransferase system IIA component (Ntr-type)